MTGTADDAARPGLRIIYRSHGGENAKNRPPYYSKLLGLASVVRAVRESGVSPDVVYWNDGPIPIDRLEVMRTTGEVVQIDGGSNRRSYRAAIELAPTGFTRMLHHEGEIAVARAAERAGVPYCLSTMGTTSIEDLAAAAPGGRRWFQLYMWKDRDVAQDLVVRASRAGFEALILTVDTPVMGSRLRDRRNGLTMPPTLTARTVVDMARHPYWWFNVLTTPPLSFASLASSGGSIDELGHNMFNATLSVEDLQWLRQQWNGKLVVKGIQSLDDARLVVDAGADALVLSNHGGRQLDRSPTPLELLPSVVDAVGDHAEIYIDSGITNGADVIAAVALGARACLVGRAYLYGLMAGGEAGVDRMLNIFHEDMLRTLQLMGAVNLDDVKGHVSLSARSAHADTESPAG
jgi:L-lactate dehydrogenase (cytochrome)